MQSVRHAGQPLFARGRNRRTLVAWAAVPLVVGIGIGVLIGGNLRPPSPVDDSPATPNEPVRLDYSDMPCDPGSSVLVLHSLEGAMRVEDVKTLLDYETMWVKHRENANPALRGQTALLTRRDDVCDAIVPEDSRFTQFVWIGPFQSDIAPSLCAALLKVTWENCIPAQVVR